MEGCTASKVGEKVELLGQVASHLKVAYGNVVRGCHSLGHCKTGYSEALVAHMPSSFTFKHLAELFRGFGGAGEFENAFSVGCWCCIGCGAIQISVCNAF